MRRLPLSAILVVLFSNPLLGADDRTAFFENRIRPVLVKECYSCHSAETKKGPKGELRLDSREGLLKGGISGSAVVPGKATESLLLKALRGDEVSTMPPRGKLPDDVIADFEKWVKMGAPDPRVGKAAPAGIDLEKGRQFWSFRPLVRPAVPRVSDAAWPSSDIDKFILSRLEAARMKPAPDALPQVLIRRVYLDLIGLPPTPAEVEEFVNDRSPDAFARVVDRLLASPRFGERWGRHWLDLARYADSNGKDENLTFHDAYLYRDYVIKCFNEDRPFDRFILEQLAGDLLPARDQAERNELLVATSFLVIGPKVLAERDKPKLRMDVVDEQIDTIGKAFLGLTLGCARCHDHKFDPVPTSDYYALAGILMSTRTINGIKLGNNAVSGWMLRTLDGETGEKLLAARKEYDARLKTLQDAIRKAKADLNTATERAAMRNPGSLAGITVDDRDAKLVGAWKASQFVKPYVGEGYVHDDKAGKGEKTATFVPRLPKPGEYEVLVSYTTGPTRATNVPVTISFDGGTETILVDQTKPPKVDGLFHSLGKFKFKAGTEGAVVIGNKGTEGHVIVDAVRFVPSGGVAPPVEAVMGVAAEAKKAVEDAAARLKKLEQDEAEAKQKAPPSPRMVMAVRDEDRIEDAHINIRGNPYQLGAVVPRGVLQVVQPGTKQEFPRDQSGRRQLAEWIASRDNPLTARVAVNRVWAHLFGSGLVRTVDNFGIQGEAPSHPELLDALASQFMKDGWSHKKLIRSIVLSRTYRQAVVPRSKNDPENRLFGSASRRRVDAEVIRDSILQVSGKLDLNGGGPVVSHFPERAIDNDSKGGFNTDPVLKRAVYLPVIRNDVPTLFEVFDFADPDVSTGQRDATTVSTQALYLMNSTFVNDQARAAASRLLAEASDDTKRLDLLFRRALGRPPSPSEAAGTLMFLTEYHRTIETLSTGQRPKDPTLAAWSAVCLSVFGSTEFRFSE
jgi:hypothetical protein